jgi:hypothetical protein
MAINSASFGAVPIQQTGKVALTLVSARPDPSAQLDPARTPGELIAYYNPGTDKVELFTASAGGTFWMEVG